MLAVIIWQYECEKKRKLLRNVFSFHTDNTYFICDLAGTTVPNGMVLLMVLHGMVPYHNTLVVILV